MRYAIVRRIEGEAPPAAQRRWVQIHGCDVIVEQGEPNREDQRALRNLLGRLRADDEVLISSLELLQMSTGELAVLLRRFFEVGVSLKLVGASTVINVVGAGGTPRMLSLLADHETRRPSRPPTSQRSRANLKSLSRYQLDYAAALRRQGHPIRTIGLLFQMTPNELLQLIGGDPLDEAEA
ncbi:MAG: site-specific recombinase, resolvase family [Phenylobacterium sp.]|nr:site-specific recombinase, resolvase family [Phenylobacterium sp.]